MSTITEHAVKCSIRGRLLFSAQTSAQYLFQPGTVAKFGIQSDQYQVELEAVGLQSSTLTINTAAPSTLYTMTVNGASVSVTSPSSGETPTTIAAQLVAAGQANAFLNANYTFSNTAGVITIVSKNAGKGFTLAGDTNSTASAASVAVNTNFTIINKDHTGFTVIAGASFTGWLEVVIHG